MERKGIAVYCASSADIDKTYFATAREIGRGIALLGYDVVCGGGCMGLMAAVIDGALEAGGNAIGVLPRFMMERNWNHQGLSRTIVTESMHERKECMASLSCAAIALPGGVGTLDELFEIITWRQLGLYDGNVVILDDHGFYSPLLNHLQHTDEQHFMRHGSRTLWKVAETPEEALDLALTDNELIN